MDGNELWLWRGGFYYFWLWLRGFECHHLHRNDFRLIRFQIWDNEIGRKAEKQCSMDDERAQEDTSSALRVIIEKVYDSIGVMIGGKAHRIGRTRCAVHSGSICGIEGHARFRLSFRCALTAPF